MAVQVTYPGVYIDEFAPGAPIQGVGTSTAAFIGVAMRGDLNRPTKITSWDQFQKTFGEYPVQGFFLWYAVRGFFENGGQVCYIVRASNGDYGTCELQNCGNQNAFHIRARQPGKAAIKVQIDPSHKITGATLYQPTTTVTKSDGRNITVASPTDAAQFRPGDMLDIGGETVLLNRVNNSVLQLATQPITAPAHGAQVRLADTPAGARTIRLSPNGSKRLESEALCAGTILKITQNGTPPATPVAATTPVAPTVATDPAEPAAAADSAAPATTAYGVVDSVQVELNGSNITYRVTFRTGLTAALCLDSTKPAAIESEEVDLKVNPGSACKPYNHLSIDPAHPKYIIKALADDALITVEPVQPPPVAILPDSLLNKISSTPVDGNNAKAEDLKTIVAVDFIKALDTLRAVDDVNIIAVPDATVLDQDECTAVQQAIIAHCEQLADRFGVLDARLNFKSGLFGDKDSLEAQRVGLDSTRGYAGLYFPWLRVQPAGAGAPMLVPPSGHVCGIFARSDSKRGVHKAPANEIVNGALGVAVGMSDIDQGLLNLKGINIIRVFSEGGRPVLWGARTTATDLNWQYVNIRRLFLYLEESIQEGIRWAVFEPNNLPLWQKLRRTITDFLTRAWRDGALFGEKPEEAFYVRIDEVLNPFSEQQLGRLNIEIGLRPSYPTEFIVVRIGIWSGGKETNES